MAGARDLMAGGRDRERNAVQRGRDRGSGRGCEAGRGAGPGAVRAGGLPVWAASVPGAAPPGQVQVSVASRQATTAAGVRGLILTVGHSSPENLVIPSAVASRAGTAAGPGIAARVHVSVNYSVVRLRLRG